MPPRIDAKRSYTLHNRVTARPAREARLRSNREWMTLESTIVNPPETTVANADLWTKYFRQEWERWLPPRATQESPLAAVAESTAAQVAGLLTLVAAGPIAWLYSANAAQLGIERRASDPVSMVPEAPAAPEHHAA